MTKHIGPINQAYGELKEDLHFTGYAFERGCHRLRQLLSDDSWKQCGGGFDNVDDFLGSLQLEQFAKIAEERREIAKLIKELRPELSTRAIGRALKVAHTTVVRRAPQKGEKTSALNDGVVQGAPTSGASAVPPSGTEAAKAVVALEARQERKARKDSAKHAVANAVFSEDGPFGSVVIDPPWAIEKIDRDVRPNQAEFDYPVMSEDELRSFWHVEMVPRIEPDCHLFMWTTQKFLPVALKLIGEFGFRYAFTMVWHKAGGFQPVDLPQFNCEFVVYARRGSPVFITTKDFPCCFDGERREHSRKPDRFYEIVRRVTGGSRIDVFSREPREGFAQFGNESGRFAA
jgi:N6-adenosine-specific RNA methylase IME4